MRTRYLTHDSNIWRCVEHGRKICDRYYVLQKQAEFPPDTREYQTKADAVKDAMARSGSQLILELADDSGWQYQLLFGAIYAEDD